jgi:hypothetical protein
MTISAKVGLSSAVLALAMLAPVSALASTPSDHQQGPVVHDRTPHVHSHSTQSHRG